MKKNFVSSVLFVLITILSAAFASTISAASANCPSEKVTNADALEASEHVVINEAYGGSEAGGIYNADFIELYNPSAAVADISDYSVQYYTAGQINSGAPTSTAHIPASTVMQPFSYYVIRVSPDNRAGAVLPCASLDDSASFAETGIASDGGKLVLSSTGADLPDCTSSLNVVDRIGWGATPQFECNELFNANQPSSTTSVQRRYGRADSDNNSLDFTSASAPSPCGQILAPTAAEVSVGGRVTNSSNAGVSNVTISLMNSTGLTATETTDSAGYYNFSNVPAGNTYIIAAQSKRFEFNQSAQVMNINEATDSVNFIANPAPRARKSIRMF